MSIRVSFSGKMKSGKDSACNLLQGKLGGETIHLFQSGYSFVSWLLLYPLLGLKIDPEHKTRTERLLLQYVGMWGRKLFGKDIWLNATLKKIQKMKGNVFVTGVRFPNEIKRLKEIGIESIHIVRPLADRLASGAFNIDHETETGLDNFKDFDHIVSNNGTLTEFKEKVEALIPKFNNIAIGPDKVWVFAPASKPSPNGWSPEEKQSNFRLYGQPKETLKEYTDALDKSDLPRIQLNDEFKRVQKECLDMLRSERGLELQANEPLAAAVTEELARMEREQVVDDSLPWPEAEELKVDTTEIQALSRQMLNDSQPFMSNEELDAEFEKMEQYLLAEREEGIARLGKQMFNASVDQAFAEICQILENNPEALEVIKRELAELIAPKPAKKKVKKLTKKVSNKVTKKPVKKSKKNSKLPKKAAAKKH